jgi:hypothetical protein
MPLDFPRAAAVWDPAHHVIRFPAEDTNTRATIDCSITGRAMMTCFGAVAASPADLLGSFERFRGTIQFAASVKYDRAGGGNAVRLLTRDLEAAARLDPNSPLPTTSRLGFQRPF